MMRLQEWKKIVAAPATDLLRKSGFRKKGLRFSAHQGDASMHVDFQSSQASDRHQLKITVNLSIRLGQLDRDPTIFASDGHWRQRIGRFMADPRDHWWLCRNDEEARRAGEEIAAILEEAALPEMERLASDEALKALWIAGHSPGLTEHQRLEYLRRLGGDAIEPVSDT